MDLVDNNERVRETRSSRGLYSRVFHEVQPDFASEVLGASVPSPIPILVDVSDLVVPVKSPLAICNWPLLF